MRHNVDYRFIDESRGRHEHGYLEISEEVIDTGVRYILYMYFDKINVPFETVSVTVVGEIEDKEITIPWFISEYNRSLPDGEADLMFSEKTNFFTYDIEVTKSDGTVFYIDTGIELLEVEEPVRVSQFHVIKSSIPGYYKDLVGYFAKNSLKISNGKEILYSAKQDGKIGDFHIWIGMRIDYYQGRSTVDRLRALRNPNFGRGEKCVIVTYHYGDDDSLYYATHDKRIFFILNSHPINHLNSWIRRIISGMKNAMGNKSDWSIVGNLLESNYNAVLAKEALKESPLAVCTLGEILLSFISIEEKFRKLFLSSE